MTAQPGTLPTTLLDPRAKPPARSRSGDAAYDLAALDGCVIEPGGRALVGTGVAIAIPAGWCGLIVPRSGLAARDGVVPVLGLIDPNYRGELRITLRNQGDTRYDVEAGHRIAQLLIVPFGAPAIELVGELPEAPDDRDTSGFGSSGR
mgnify:CR=1 FL=1